MQTNDHHGGCQDENEKQNVRKFMEICCELVDKLLQILGAMKANKEGIKSHGQNHRLEKSR